MWWLLACRDPDPRPRPPPPPCFEREHAEPSSERVPEVRLAGSWPLNPGEAERSWVGAFDGGHCADLWIGEIWSNAAPLRYHLQQRWRERILRVSGDAGSGLLGEVGEIVVSATEDAEPNESLGSTVLGDPHRRSWYANTLSGGADAAVFAFDANADGWTTQDAQGTVTLTHFANAVRLGRIEAGTGFLVAAANRWKDISAFDGVVRLYPLPLARRQDGDDPFATFHGDPGENHQAVDGAHDLTGDGQPDLLVGSIGAARVALLAHLPAGTHRTWDVADAIVRHPDPGSYFGDTVLSGDLDGDGHADLLAGAPLDGAGLVVGCRGPFRLGEERSTDDCEWQIRGDEDLDRASPAALGDFDGDGATDLAVGLPGNPYLSPAGGRVLLFRGPLAPGEHGPADASVVLTSAGVAGPDRFGAAMSTGDLDGDGTDDLVVHVPGDLDGEGRPAGSVQILFGAADLFPDDSG